MPGNRTVDWDEAIRLFLTSDIKSKSKFDFIAIFGKNPTLDQIIYLKSRLDNETNKALNENNDFYKANLQYLNALEKEIESAIFDAHYAECIQCVISDNHITKNPIKKTLRFKKPEDVDTYFSDLKALLIQQGLKINTYLESKLVVKYKLWKVFHRVQKVELHYDLSQDETQLTEYSVALNNSIMLENSFTKAFIIKNLILKLVMNNLISKKRQCLNNSSETNIENSAQKDEATKKRKRSRRSKIEENSLVASNNKSKKPNENNDSNEEYTVRINTKVILRFSTAEARQVFIDNRKALVQTIGITIEAFYQKTDAFQFQAWKKFHELKKTRYENMRNKSDQYVKNKLDALLESLKYTQPCSRENISLQAHIHSLRTLYARRINAKKPKTSDQNSETNFAVDSNSPNSTQEKYTDTEITVAEVLINLRDFCEHKKKSTSEEIFTTSVH